ncbi:MAG: AzlD domain-containing protein [Dehalococcoidia bacterium]|nr:AzlD domain-containing protein [Dehalococcoidia bacterium]
MDMPVWQQFAAIAVIALGTYAMRAVFIVIPAARGVAASLDRWLVHARPAILAALVASVLAGTAEAEATATFEAALRVWAPLLVGTALALGAGLRWGLLGALIAGMAGYVAAGLVV